MRTILYIWLALSASMPALAGKAHEHGVGRMDVAVDGAGLVISLETPLDSLVGFERAPRNDKERAAVKAMAERLRNAETLFAPSAEGGCRLASVRLTSPVIDPALLGSDAGRPSAKADAGRHADLTGEFEFRCAAPGAVKSVDVLLFEAFPKLERLRVQAVTPAGQKGATLTAKSRRLAW